MLAYTITAAIFPITVSVPGLAPAQFGRADLPVRNHETRPLVVHGREVGTMTRYNTRRHGRKVRFDAPDSVVIERANSRRRLPGLAGGISATINRDTEV